MNTQPWHLYVLTGAALDNVRRGNTERNLAGVAPSREIRSHGAYRGAHRRRQIDIAVQLFEAMGTARDDAEKRQDWVMRSFRLQGADIAQFDCGALVNGLVTAAWSKGLGAVVNSQGIMQSPVACEHARIP
jgi:hypothetical protein